ncbi:1,2-phenylacetyl-CoA epoxidase subunit PaaC [Peribacillus alkalitolerans]|uniref:1,2-phenylacetyl-CoA epoxidase subunit PaaC n=1 Tax=Peribacillus alkalitolerans TaxID=1550385 RepID=UPI0013D81EB8|nr:1,2-phenylacetyl-CoA epoxidase subunit PaaC [Peribacillus alkalitolerans]
MTEQLEQTSKLALIELLYQLADDDFILAYRGSEWLGLAPHIEEDVAYSSINQDTMGHAVMYYRLLEELGEKDMDYLAHARPASERKNAIILEKVNGPGTYLQEPKYDWAFAVVRHFFYSHAKKIKINSLKTSSYKPLADTAVKVSMELYYHQMHWNIWFKQLVEAGGEARTRMEQAINIVIKDFGDVLSLGALSKEMSEAGLIEAEDVLIARFHSVMNQMFTSSGLTYTAAIGKESGEGRKGEHTPDLQDALKVLSEVYASDPAAIW